MQATRRQCVLPLLVVLLVCCCGWAQQVLGARLDEPLPGTDGLQQQQPGAAPGATGRHYHHQLLPGRPLDAALAAALQQRAGAAAAGDGATGDSDSDEPQQQQQQHKKKHHKKKKGSSDYADEDPAVRSHWALLVAGSSGWYNYRHQADVYHAYRLLLAGGYHADRIVVMAADDIAHDPANPMPGKVFNAPGGPDVYAKVAIDYRGADVTAETFLAVLGGDAGKVAGKGTGRVLASGPHDKVFVFYSDHGAAGVLGMPTGPFLYADEFIKGLKRKHAKGGFRELVLYIEACESGSMFEGLLGNDLSTYVTTAANAVESSWATYCPSFDTASTDGSGGGGSADGVSNGGGSSVVYASGGAWRRVAAWLQRLLLRWTAVGGRGTAAAAAAADDHTASAAPAPPPEFDTCLGDLYSVAWMEDAETGDLTSESLLQQYKRVKMRASQNFTYDQGSHVMQYGDLSIDHELAGDYEGMLHNGSGPPSSSWTAMTSTSSSSSVAAAAPSKPQEQQQGAGANHALSLYSSPGALLARLGAGGAAAGTGQQQQRRHRHQHRQHQQRHVEQRDADLVPLAAAAHRSPCPRRRAAAAGALARATAGRQRLEAAARAAAAGLLRAPGVGGRLIAALGWRLEHVLPAAAPGALAALAAAAGAGGHPGNTAAAPGQQQQQLREPALLLGDARVEYVEALLAPLPGREGRPLVDSWECLREMVQAWEARCGALDQFGMKLTRMFANLCNGGVDAAALSATLAAGPCRRRLE